ncbi:hypothetical protein QWE_06383 [Agrobacterium albertimagni AOL15]|uniref:Uncharacterized protein n=1 Tax=Agrobacterium albertimagni AOL15 TaxID=1156935 RepID=K2QYK1_9HYPH|nr:hypothetical protein [Agrobacterium albertimagni]EKF60672.1 hypothetical protein QWE_06383 [Agrobacterium albertimagni AOL15]
MLPPVLASPASYTATEAKPRPEQPAGSRAQMLAPPPTTTAINQNSAIAGQLNIMLLSGPERMSQNLAVLADVLGAALKIERRSDETLGDYMGRLIEGIAALPAVDRLKLQKLLTQSFAGLQLRTLLAAMASPSGPERATLALYLELYRQTDRDGATRSVISSYREAAGEARSTAQSVSRPSAANDVGRAPSDAPRPAQPAAEQNRTLSTPAPQSGGKADVRTENAEPPQRSGMNLALSARATTRSPSSSLAGPGLVAGSPESPKAAMGTSQAPQKATPEPQTSRAAPSGGLQPSPSDRPSMPAEGGQRLPTSASEVARQPEERASAGAGSPDRPASSPAAAIAMSATAVQGQARSAPSIPGGWLAELFESDFVRTLLQLKSLSTEPQTSARPAFLPPTDTPLTETSAAQRMSRDEASDSAERLARMPEAALKEAAEERPLPGVIPLSEQALARFPIGREGVPLPFIPYQLEDEFDVEHVEEKEEEESGSRDAEADGNEDDLAEAADEDADAMMAEHGHPADGPSEPYAPESMVAEPHALPAPSGTALPLPPEPAHELYLRMAGLT